VTERLAEEWDVVLAKNPELPKELHGKNPDEKPKPPDVKVPGGKPRGGGMGDVEAEEGKYLILELRPKKEPLKGFVESVRLHLRRDDYRIEKIAVDDATSFSLFRLTGWKALEKMEESLFRLDLTGVTKERK
jgi:hypothetical protein